MELKLIIDIIFAMGICGFISASLKQFIKIIKTKKTAGLSLKKYYIKMYSISCMIIAYILSQTFISLTISLMELIICLLSAHFIIRYRWGKFEWRRLLK